LQYCTASRRGEAGIILFWYACSKEGRNIAKQLTYGCCQAVEERAANCGAPLRFSL